MTSVTTTQARKSLYALVDETAASHQPIQITGKRHNAVLISEEDWISLQETLALVSIPGMKESIQAGMRTSVEDCDTELKW